MTGLVKRYVEWSTLRIRVALPRGRWVWCSYIDAEGRCTGCSGIDFL